MHVVSSSSYDITAHVVSGAVYTQETRSQGLAAQAEQEDATPRILTPPGAVIHPPSPPALT